MCSRTCALLCAPASALAHLHTLMESRTVTTCDRCHKRLPATLGTTFDHMRNVIAPDATQAQVYETIAQPLVHTCVLSPLSPYNTIFF
jgi:hypothetical protein